MHVEMPKIRNMGIIKQEKNIFTELMVYRIKYMEIRTEWQETVRKIYTFFKD